MKILHVLPVLNPSHGGPPAVAARLAAGQAAAGHKPCIFYQDSPDQQREIADSLKGIPGIVQVEMAPVSPHLQFGAIVPKSTRDALKARIAGSDVIQLHGIWHPILWQAAREARRQGKPYIVTPHGMLDPWCLSQGRWKKKIALWLTFRRMLQNAACLHLLNEDEARLMSPLGLSTPIRVIANGVFLEEIDPLPEPGSFLKRCPQIAGSPFVLFLSRLHYKKGLDYLADAFAAVLQQAPKARLVVAGPDGGAQAEFLKQVQAMGIADRVHLVGALYGPDKFAAMVDAACFCLPSRQEGFSVAILEALACGTAVVISEACHFPEVAQANAGLVVELEASAIAAALCEFLKDPHRAAQTGARARALVSSRYTWHAIAQQTLEMYQSALGERASREAMNAAGAEPAVRDHA